jgi:DNA-binding transcriptional LysR family regulator
MRNLNLDHLRTLTDVVALGSFSAAARRLNLSQPAVSLHIRELEQRFGVRLIERLGKRAFATAPGRELIEHADHIFRDCDSAASAMRRFKHGWIGSVHIGTTLTALTYELPPILKKLRESHPGIDLLVTNMSTRDSVENMMKSAIDLALVTLPVKAAGLRITPLRPEKLVAIFPADTPDLPKEVTPEYVAGRLLVLEHTRGAIYSLVTHWLAKHMPLSRTPMHLGTVEAMKSVVASKLGISIVPDISVATPSRDIVVRPLKPELPCTLALIERRSRPNEPGLEIVRSALLELKTDWGWTPRRSIAASRRISSRNAGAPAKGLRRAS